MANRPAVALDLDDLIYPFIENMLPWANQRLNKNVQLEDLTTFNFEEIWGGTRSESIDLMHEYFDTLTASFMPLAGSDEAINKLSDEFELSIITSRTDPMREVTMDWLETHFPGTFFEIHLTNGYVTDGRFQKRAKVDICQELGAIALVDDNFTNVREVADVGLHGILYGDYPWNRNFDLPAGVVRALNWNEVIDELLSLR